MRPFAPQAGRRGIPRALVAATIATAVVASSAAPTLARGMLLPAVSSGELDQVKTTNVNFRHHFYRGQPYGSWQDDSRSSWADRAADVRVQDAAAYCSDRFKSYDPSTGTYLGYDGNEHSCP